MPRLSKKQREDIESRLRENDMTIARISQGFVVREKRRRRKHGVYNKRGWAVRRALDIIEGRNAANKVQEILDAEAELR